MKRIARAPGQALAALISLALFLPAPSAAATVSRVIPLAPSAMTFAAAAPVAPVSLSPLAPSAMIFAAPALPIASAVPAAPAPLAAASVRSSAGDIAAVTLGKIFDGDMDALKEVSGEPFSMENLSPEAADLVKQQVAAAIRRLSDLRNEIKKVQSGRFGLFLKWKISPQGKLEQYELAYTLDGRRLALSSAQIKTLIA